MFLIFSISSGLKQLGFSQTVICPSCGQFGRMDLFIAYSYFSLFFIPILKWNKQYYLQSQCCQAIFELDKETGKALANGQKTSISENDLLHMTKNGRKHCASCGTELLESFAFCPICGKKL